MNHRKTLSLIALLLIVPSLICAGGDKDENPTPIPTATPTPTPTATSAPLDCCPSTEDDIVPVIGGIDPTTQEYIWMGKMADVDLGSDICKEWVEDPNHPGYMTLSIAVSGGEDLDVCPDWFDIWPDGLTYLNDELVVFSGSLPGYQGDRIFYALIPEPSNGCKAYDLTASVTDLPPADPAKAHCFYPDGTNSDSISIYVWKCQEKSATGSGQMTAVTVELRTLVLWPVFHVLNYTARSFYTDCNGTLTTQNQTIVYRLNQRNGYSYTVRGSHQLSSCLGTYPAVWMPRCTGNYMVSTGKKALCSGNSITCGDYCTYASSNFTIGLGVRKYSLSGTASGSISLALNSVPCCGSW